MASRMYLGNPQRHGLSAAARERFGRPLSALSFEEAATLVAISISPSRCLGSQESLDRCRDALIRRMSNRVNRTERHST